MRRCSSGTRRGGGPPSRRKRAPGDRTAGPGAEPREHPVPVGRGSAGCTVCCFDPHELGLPRGAVRSGAGTPQRARDHWRPAARRPVHAPGHRTAAYSGAPGGRRPVRAGRVRREGHRRRADRGRRAAPRRRGDGDRAVVRGRRGDGERGGAGGQPPSPRGPVPPADPRGAHRQPAPHPGARGPADPAFGETTVNIGVIAGGTRPNVVAAEARADLQIRLVTDARPVQALLEQAVAGRAQIEYLTAAPLVRLTTVPGFETCLVRFTTDIPHLANWGSPLLVGPGSILPPHGEDPQPPQSQPLTPPPPSLRLLPALP